MSIGGPGTAGKSGEPWAWKRLVELDFIWCIMILVSHLSLSHGY